MSIRLFFNITLMMTVLSHSIHFLKIVVDCPAICPLDQLGCCNCHFCPAILISRLRPVTVTCIMYVALSSPNLNTSIC